MALPQCPSLWMLLRSALDTEQWLAKRGFCCLCLWFCQRDFGVHYPARNEGWVGLSWRGGHSPLPRSAADVPGTSWPPCSEPGGAELGKGSLCTNHYYKSQVSGGLWQAQSCWGMCSRKASGASGGLLSEGGADAPPAAGGELWAAPEGPRFFMCAGNNVPSGAFKTYYGWQSRNSR